MNANLFFIIVCLSILMASTDAKKARRAAMESSSRFTDSATVPTRHCKADNRQCVREYARRKQDISEQIIANLLRLGYILENERIKAENKAQKKEQEKNKLEQWSDLFAPGHLTTLTTKLAKIMFEENSGWRTLITIATVVTVAIPGTLFMIIVVVMAIKKSYTLMRKTLCDKFGKGPILPMVIVSIILHS